MLYEPVLEIRGWATSGGGLVVIMFVRGHESRWFIGHHVLFSSVVCIPLTHRKDLKTMLRCLWHSCANAKFGICLVRNSLQSQEAQMQLGQQLSESRSRVRELRMAKEVT
jgi:hypothetical protein